MKKSSQKTCRDLESSLETLEDVKAGRGKPMSEKDVGKLEKNVRKLEESLVKNDREYKESNMRTEEARLAWEGAMYRCCQVRGEGRGGEGGGEGRKGECEVSGKVKWRWLESV